MTYDLSFINFSKLDNEEYNKENNIKVKNIGSAFFNVKYVKKALNGNNYKTLGLCRSFLVDSGGNIVCFSPPKSLQYQYFTQDLKDSYIEEFVEGTMINMFYDKNTNDWEITTRSTLGAKCKFNMDCDKTFRYMFLSTMNEIGLEFEDFDKNFCYSFVLQHPDNKIVLPIKKPRIILVDIFKCNGNKVDVINRNMFHNQTHLFVKNDKIEKPALIIDYDKTKSLTEILKELVYNKDYRCMGYYVHNNGERTKIRNPNYEHVKHLKGNSPKIQYQYYNLRQLNKVKDFLKFFPEHKQDFAVLRSNLHKYTQNLYKNYNDCYIHKVKPLKTYPYEYKTHMYHLHNLYLNDLKNDGGYVNFFVVKSYVNNLEPARLMHVVNYPLKKDKFYQKKIIIENTIENEGNVSNNI